VEKKTLDAQERDQLKRFDALQFLKKGMPIGNEWKTI
jgi:hypothetical protein